MMSNAAPRQIVRVLGWLGFWAVSTICLSAGCSKSDESAEGGGKPKYEVDDENAGSTNTEALANDTIQGGGLPVTGIGVDESGSTMRSDSGMPVQPPSIPGSQLETITVPDGTPAELLDFANRMGDKIMTLRAETGGLGLGASKVREIELFRAIISASDKVLARSDATSEQRKGAIDNTAGAMSLLSRLEPEADWAGQVREFAVSLTSDKDPAIAIEGRSIVFGMLLGEFMQGRSRDVDGLMNQLKSLLQDEARSNVVMSVSLQTMTTLLDLGHDDQAREALDLIIAAFKDSSDPGLAAEAARLTEQALFVDAEIEPKFRAVVANRAGAEEVFLSELARVLAEASPGSLTLEKGARYIGELQQTGHYELARKLCQIFQDSFANSSDEDVKQGADQLTQMALRRLDLIGQPLVVEGRRLDGVSLDFSFYQEKTVLVVFFGAFDPGCQQALMDIKSAYQKYHERGFEVIGVSVDPNRELLKQFLDQAKLPWMTVTNSKFAEQCGADMLPFGVLLDRTGKVTSIFVQGSALHGKLEALFGSPGTTKPPAAKSLSPLGDQSRNVPMRPIRLPGTGFVAAGFAAVGPDDTVVTQADETTPGQDPQDEVTSELELDEAEKEMNPYLAREGLSPAELINFLFDMQDRPKSIRRRAGFAEAMVDAADCVLRSDAKAKYQLIAAETKLDILHEVACLGGEEADQKLIAFVSALAGDKRPRIARRIEFFQLERRVLEADELDLKEIPALLTDLQRYFEAQSELATRDLRIASATVHAVNRLEEDKTREEYFIQFGNLFAKSGDRQLARYGKKLAKGGKGRAKKRTRPRPETRPGLLQRYRKPRLYS